MRSIKGMVMAALMCPAIANACGGGANTVGIALLVALFILMTPAFLIPLAGILALRPENSQTYVRLFFIYAVVGIGVAILDILTQPPDYVTVALIMVCAAVLVAPTIHYVWCAARSSRNVSCA